MEDKVLSGGETARERKKRILALVKSKGVEWLELECAMWTVEIMETSYHKLSDPFKPQAVKSFELEVPLYDRKRLDKSFYSDNPAIGSYYERKSKVVVDNSSNKHWLGDVLRVLEDNDKTIEAIKVRERLKQFN